MQRFLQYVFDGLSVGAVYALIALGLVVIYRGTGHLNFAQGEMALFATYVAWWFNDQGLHIILATIMAMLVAFIGGALVELCLIRPTGKKSPLAVVVVAIGLFLGLNSLAGLIWGIDPLTFESLFPNEPTDFVKISGAAWRYERLGVLLVVLALTGVIFFLFQKTKIGLAMRAVANNGDSARLVGIRTGRILMMSWGLAGAIGALGGTMIASINGNVNGGMMFTVFIYGSAAATLGGLDSPGGAVIAGLSLGVIESVVVGYSEDWFGTDLGDIRIGVAFVVILAVLLFKPSGLFGSTRVERV
jgi:branched-chain amino acid transport system permease protein